MNAWTALALGLTGLQVAWMLLLLILAIAIIQRQQVDNLELEHQANGPGEAVPGVSVIIPIKGLDPGARQHFEAWIDELRWAGFEGELLFSLQDQNDPALPLVQELVDANPEQCRLVLQPLEAGLNGKASNLLHGVEQARYPWLVFADSDVEPGAGFLPALVNPLLSRSTGLVAGIAISQGRGFWGRLNALNANLTLLLGWATSTFLGLDAGASGAVLALRQGVLDSVGGVPAFGQTIAEDYQLGRLVREHGWQVHLGPCLPLNMGTSSAAAVLGLMQRGALMFRFLAPPATAASFLLGNYFFYLLLAAGLVARLPAVMGLAAAGLGLRIALTLILQLAIDEAWWEALLIPLLDLLNVIVVLVTFAGYHRVTWRGVSYRVSKGGKVNKV